MERAPSSRRLLWRTAWADEMFEHPAGQIGGQDRLLDSIRWQDAWDEFELSKITRISDAARRLCAARNAGALLDRYEHLDRRIEKIERLLDEAAISWDRFVQEESGRLCGK